LALAGTPALPQMEQRDPSANLDEGAMWRTSFALKELTPTEEARIAALVKKAVS